MYTLHSTVRNVKKTKLDKQKTKEHMKCSYMYVYTCMIFAVVLSPTIKNISPTFRPKIAHFCSDSTDILRRFYDISPPFHRRKTPTKVISC